MLSSFVYIASHPRQLVASPPRDLCGLSVPALDCSLFLWCLKTFNSQLLTFNLSAPLTRFLSYRFTDPHPLTLLESHRFKNAGGEGVSPTFRSPNSLRLNSFADPHPLTSVLSIFYKNSTGRGLLLASFCRETLILATKDYRVMEISRI